MTTSEIKSKIAQYEKVLAGSTDAQEKTAIQNGIAKLKIKLKEAEESEKTPEPKVEVKKEEKKEIAKPVVKVEPKKEEKKAKKKKSKKDDDFDCEEAERLMKERRAKAKESADKKTQPILKIMADKMESVVKSAIHYNDVQGNAQKPEKLKQAVGLIEKAMHLLKDGTNPELEDKYIDEMVSSLKKIIEQLTKKKSKFELGGSVGNSEWIKVDSFGTAYKVNYRKYGEKIGLKLIDWSNIEFIPILINDTLPSDEESGIVDVEDSFGKQGLLEWLEAISKPLFGFKSEVKLNSEGEERQMLTYFDILFIINQVFPFDKVTGSIDDSSINITAYSKGSILFTIKGEYDGIEEKTVAIISIDGKTAKFSSYEFDGMGGLDEVKLYKELLRVKRVLMPIFSSVIAYEGYAIEEEIGYSHSEKEAEEKLEEMKQKLSYHVVKGKQIANKLIGDVWSDEEDD